MNYQQFIATIQEKLSLHLEDLEIQIHATLKNNGKERTGLTFSDKQINLCPTIYLEEFYQQFQNGLPIDDIIESILDIYYDVKFEHSWQVDSIKDFDIIQKKIVYKIINADKNERLLQTLPYNSYLDFAIVYYILFDIDASGTATIPITTDLLNAWHTDVETIHQIALKNTPKLLPYSFKPMRVVIDELLAVPCINQIQENDLMFVLTNSLRSFGAACILYDNILHQIGTLLNDSYFLLPSSIHEIIIVPKRHSPDIDSLNEMVAEINETQVDLEDVLSDHVYYYDLVKNQLLS